MSRLRRLAAAAALAVLTIAALPPLLLAAQHLFGTASARRLALATLALAGACTALCLLLGAPLAWALRLAAERLRQAPAVAAAGPVVLGLLARAAGFLIVLGEFGLLNLVLRTLQIETDLFRRGAVLAQLAVLGGMVQVFAPFMVLSLYHAMARIDLGLVRALRSLGRSHAAIFFAVALPLSRGGAAAGAITVFVLASGAAVTVALFGARQVRALAGVAVEQSTLLLGWQIAALLVGLGAVAVLLLGRVLRQPPPNRRKAAPRTSA